MARERSWEYGSLSRMNPMSNRLLALGSILLPAVRSVTASEPGSPFWSRFRGPNGSGVVNSLDPPVKIDADTPAWRTPVPSGMSSPIVAGDHLFLASARGVVTVVKTGDVFTIEHQENLEAPVFATPAMDENSLYLRTENGLMAFRRS